MVNSELKKSEDSSLESREASRGQLATIYSEMVASIGLTGREIARLSGTRPQYISDIKRRQRPLSHEMFMRTLVGLYGKYKWLISGDLPVDTERIVKLYPHISRSDSPIMPLPVFQRPFMGPKMTAEDWDGAFICVTSPIKERAAEMTDPYILHLPFDDKSGRLRKGDYLLVNQIPTSTTNYVLIKSGWGVKLVKRAQQGFEDVENGELRDGSSVQVIGSVVMLLHGAL